MMAESARKPIGGYFELELPSYPEYHSEALALNSGRFCLEYLLRCRNYQKVYVPYFTCDTVIEPIQRLEMEYEFYHIDRKMHLSDDVTPKENEAIIYTNYWGVQNSYCEHLALKYGNRLILDYTQAFFSKPILGIDTFYSCRKYFGVPDGGYLYTDCIDKIDIPQDESYTRMDSLLKRLDLSPEAGYDDFRKTSSLFHSMPVKQMSKLTKRMMQGIDYGHVAQSRLDNYNQLCKHLAGGRKLNSGEVPMVYPYESEKGQLLRQHLIENKIFVAKYWPNVDEWAPTGSTETWLANHVLPLPIDQRYGEEDMRFIIERIKEYES